MFLLESVKGSQVARTGLSDWITDFVISWELLFQQIDNNRVNLCKHIQLEGPHGRFYRVWGRWFMTNNSYSLLYMYYIQTFCICWVYTAHFNWHLQPSWHDEMLAVIHPQTNTILYHCAITCLRPDFHNRRWRRRWWWWCLLFRRPHSNFQMWLWPQNQMLLIRPQDISSQRSIG